MSLIDITSINAPGTYVTEKTVGLIPTELADHNRCYMLGTSASGDYAKPTQVINVADATNIFGNIHTISQNSMKLFFRNYLYGVLYFIRVPIGKTYTVTMTDIGTAADTITVSVGAATLTYTIPSTPAIDTVLNALVTAINATNSTIKPLAIAENLNTTTDSFTLRILDPTTNPTVNVTGSGDVEITEVADSNTVASKHDYVWTIENAFDPDEHSQGFLIAPEAFGTLNQASRLVVASSLESKAASEGFDWVTLIDAGHDTTTPALAKTEGELITTTHGHAAYYFPYLQDLEDAWVPPSAGIAAIACARYAAAGFREPPAGASYPIAGVQAVQYTVKRQHQEELNPAGINCLRRLPGQGILAYGARTRAASPYYRFVNTRVILNVLIGTLRHAFDSVIFTAVDGQGILFMRIRETCNAICYRMWQAGALFGATPTEAFYVRCDTSNNPALDLEAGIVRADLYVVPVPTFERLLISVNRTPIGQISAVIAQSTSGTQTGNLGTTATTGTTGTTGTGR